MAMLKRNCDICKWSDYPIQAKEAPCENCHAGSHYEPFPLTNADHIRSMTDEELAAWLVLAEVRILEKQPKLNKSAMLKDWLDWLKQEVEDNE